MNRAGWRHLRFSSWCAAGIAAAALLVIAVQPARASSPAAGNVNESVEDPPLRLPEAGGAAAPAASDSDAPTAAASDPALGLSTGAARVGLALGGVIALILVLRWVGHRALAPGGVRGGRASAVRVLSRTVLAPRQQVLLLHVGRRIVVVGDSGGRMHTLCEIAEPDEVASLVGASEASSPAGETARAVFGSVFRRAKEPFAENDGGDGADGPDVLAVSRTLDGLGDEDVATVGGLLEKVRMMRSQFKGA